MKVIIYGRSTPFCPHCDIAKKLAEANHLELEYVDLAKNEWDPVTLASEKNIPPIKTVPQVFVDDTYIGGAVDFMEWVKTSLIETGN